RLNDRLKIASMSAAERQSLQDCRQEILRFLRTGARSGLACWPGFVWRAQQFEKDQPAMYLDLSLQCIQGLALSGDESARAEVERLRDHQLAHLERKAATPEGREELTSLAYPAILMEPATLASLRTAVESAIDKSIQIQARGLEQYYAASN